MAAGAVVVGAVGAVVAHTGMTLAADDGKSRLARGHHESVLQILFLAWEETHPDRALHNPGATPVAAACSAGHPQALAAPNPPSFPRHRSRAANQVVAWVPSPYHDTGPGAHPSHEDSPGCAPFRARASPSVRRLARFHAHCDCQTRTRNL